MTTGQGNSPLADYGRIHKLMIRKGLPFNKENASKYEGRTKLPFFSGGTYETYKSRSAASCGICFN